MLDKKKLRKCLIILLLIAIIIVAIILIRKTLARYETTATSEKDVDVAFWVVENSFKSDRLLVNDIYPSNTSFDYTFTVSNFETSVDGSVKKRAETDLDYELVITTTTNLPLEYQIERNGQNCIKSEEIVTDADGTFYKKITLETFSMLQSADVTDTYVIKVRFPKENNTNAQFADLMEYIKLDLNARQTL